MIPNGFEPGRTRDRKFNAKIRAWYLENNGFFVFWYQMTDLNGPKFNKSRAQEKSFFLDSPPIRSLMWSVIRSTSKRGKKILFFSHVDLRWFLPATRQRAFQHYSFFFVPNWCLLSWMSRYVCTSKTEERKVHYEGKIEENSDLSR